MSTDFNGPESDKRTDEEGSMFAAQPIWERNRKRKGFGGRKTTSAAPATPISPEPRTFAAERDYEEPMALDRPLNAPVDVPLSAAAMDAPFGGATPARDYPRSEYAAMNAGTTTNSTLAAEEDAGLVTPIAHASTARAVRPARSSSIAPAAIAAAVVGLGALGAAGWYMSRDTSGVPELAAGSTATSSELAVAPLTPVDPPAQVAVNEAPPPPAATTAAPTPKASVAVPRTTARARPAAPARSAGETGVNASTTAVLPDGPQPYSNVSPTPGATPTAPTQVNPPLVALPPSSEAPAAIPATPPTLPQEPPVTEAPKPDPTTPQ